LSTSSAPLASSLSPDVRLQLKHSLQWYQEARERWPLWTGDSDAWAKYGEAWADRIHWSSVRLLYHLSSEFRSALHKDLMLLRFLPHEEDYRYMSRDKKVFPRAVGVDQVPGIYRLRALAISAAMARRLPESVAEITVPDLSRGGLDAEDLDMLAARFQAALVELRLPRSDDPKLPLGLVGRFLKYHIDGAVNKRTLGKEAQKRRLDQWTRVAKQLLVETGLLVDRSRGRRNTLNGRTLSALRTEARDMTESVWSWSPEIEDVTSIARWSSTDPQYKTLDGVDPTEWSRLLEAKKPSLRERGRERALTSSAAHENWRLRYPFLTASECNLLRDKNRTVVQLADELILKRLPAEISHSRLRAIISLANRKTP